MKSKILSSTVLSAALLLATATPAFAETTSTTNPRTERLEQNREQACERVTQRVADQKAAIEERAAKAQELFEKQDGKLAELAAKAQAAGVDISTLQGYLDVLEGYTADITDMRADVRAEIENAVALTCDGDREGGRAAFESARAMVADIQDIRLERRQYWVNTIVPELRSIRDELKATRSASE